MVILDNRFSSISPRLTYANLAIVLGVKISFKSLRWKIFNSPDTNFTLFNYFLVKQNVRFQ